MEKILIVVLAGVFCAIGCYCLQAGHNSPIKAFFAFLISVLILLAAFRKEPTE